MEEVRKLFDFLEFRTFCRAPRRGPRAGRRRVVERRARRAWCPRWPRRSPGRVGGDAVVGARWHSPRRGRGNRALGALRPRRRHRRRRRRRDMDPRPPPRRPGGRRRPPRRPAAVQAHDVKALMRSLLAHEPPIDLAGLALDTAIAAYLLDPAEARYQLGHLIERYTRFALAPEEPAAKGQLDLDGSAAEPPTVAGREALAVHQLVEPITSLLATDGMAELYATIENPLVRVLARMEHAGVGRRRREPPRAARPPHRRGAATRRRAQGGRRARGPQHQLADPAARDPLRAPSARPDPGQEDQDRCLHRRRHAGEVATGMARVHRAPAAVPGGREAARHLRRGVARRGRPGRADPRDVQPDRRHYYSPSLVISLYYV